MLFQLALARVGGRSAALDWLAAQPPRPSRGRAAAPARPARSHASDPRAQPRAQWFRAHPPSVLLPPASKVPRALRPAPGRRLLCSLAPPLRGNRATAPGAGQQGLQERLPRVGWRTSPGQGRGEKDRPSGVPLPAWVRSDHLRGDLAEHGPAFLDFQQLQGAPRKSALRTQRVGVKGGRR